MQIRKALMIFKVTYVRPNGSSGIFSGTLESRYFKTYAEGEAYRKAHPSLSEVKNELKIAIEELDEHGKSHYFVIKPSDKLIHVSYKDKYLHRPNDAFFSSVLGNYRIFFDDALIQAMKKNPGSIIPVVRTSRETLEEDRIVTTHEIHTERCRQYIYGMSATYGLAPATEVSPVYIYTNMFPNNDFRVCFLQTGGKRITLTETIQPIPDSTYQKPKGSK